MKCENCKEEEAEYEYQGIKSCYDCLYDYFDEDKSFIIEQYIDDNCDKLPKSKEK